MIARKFIITLCLSFSAYAFCQKSDLIKIQYSDLVNAYKDYDSIFFAQIRSNDNISIVKGKRVIYKYIDPELSTPMITFYLNKKRGPSELSFKVISDTIFLTFYDPTKNMKFISYRFKINGAKPQVVLKKRRKNYYKLKHLKDCILVDEKTQS